MLSTWNQSAWRDGNNVLNGEHNKMELNWQGTGVDSETSREGWELPQRESSSYTLEPLEWVLLAAIKSVMDLINECFKSMQGKDTTVHEQSIPLDLYAATERRLVDIHTVGAVDPLLLADSQDVFAHQVHDTNTLLVRGAFVTEFIEDCPMQYARNLNKIDTDNRTAVVTIFGRWLFGKTSTPSSFKWTVTPETHQQKSRYPVLPIDLTDLQPPAFFDILELLRERTCDRWKSHRYAWQTIQGVRTSDAISTGFAHRPRKRGTCWSSTI